MHIFDPFKHAPKQLTIVLEVCTVTSVCMKEKRESNSSVLFINLTEYMYLQEQIYASIIIQGVFTLSMSGGDSGGYTLVVTAVKHTIEHVH